ncbi:MAG: hypothetical protein WA952_01350 [Lewinella sp.]
MCLVLLFASGRVVRAQDSQADKTSFAFEVGSFHYQWDVSYSGLKSVERLPGNRKHVAFRASRHIKDNFGVDVGLFYADYRSTGKTFAPGHLIKGLDHDTTAYIQVNETFIGPEIGVTYSLPIPLFSGRVYVVTGVRYGILVAGRGKGTILFVNDCWLYRGDDDYRCHLHISDFDTDKPNRGLTTFHEPGNNFSLYSSLGLELGNRRIRPYVEFRGNLGQLGVLSQAYSYNEYGFIAGLRF